jgi:hypothetical protein
MGATRFREVGQKRCDSEALSPLKKLCDLLKLTTVELATIPVFVKAAHIWVMGISANAVGDVLPYGWFDDDWLDTRLEFFRLDEEKI